MKGVFVPLPLPGAPISHMISVVGESKCSAPSKEETTENAGTGPNTLGEDHALFGVLGLELVPRAIEHEARVIDFAIIGFVALVLACCLLFPCQVWRWRRVGGSAALVVVVVGSPPTGRRKGLRTGGHCGQCITNSGRGFGCGRPYHRRRAARGVNAAPRRCAAPNQPAGAAPGPPHPQARVQKHPTTGLRSSQERRTAAASTRGACQRG